MDRTIFPYSQREKVYHCTIPKEYLVNLLREKSYSLIKKNADYINADYIMASVRMSEASRSAFGDFVEK